MSEDQGKTTTAGRAAAIEWLEREVQFAVDDYGWRYEIDNLIAGLFPAGVDQEQDVAKLEHAADLIARARRPDRGALDDAKQIIAKVRGALRAVDVSVTPSTPVTDDGGRLVPCRCQRGGCDHIATHRVSGTAGHGTANDSCCVWHLDDTVKDMTEMVTSWALRSSTEAAAR